MGGPRGNSLVPELPEKSGCRSLLRETGASSRCPLVAHIALRGVKSSETLRGGRLEERVSILEWQPADRPRRDKAAMDRKKKKKTYAATAGSGVCIICVVCVVGHCDLSGVAFRVVIDDDRNSVKV